jgi:homoserine kinase
VTGLARRRVSVDVPATTANLGAGFDALAMALDLGNRVTVEALPDASPGRAELTVAGEGAGLLPADGRNRFVAMLLRGLREAGHEPACGWRVAMDNAIPLARGLGSSAAATVGGLVAADALLGGGVLGTDVILGLAAAVEGHPDNAAASLLGGFCVVTHAEGTLRAVRLEPPDRLRVALLIPDRPLSTADMRAALPRQVPFEAAVHNVGAVALTVAAMATGRLEMLRAGTVDHLHEPYRVAVYPELPALVDAARGAGALGACLSGAGSTVIAFADSDTAAEEVASALRERAATLGLAGRTHVGRPRASGAKVIEAD